uniref:Uncharacterized protein n=1 Tax=Thermosporothrix sp. COM3 TaxID=2490863 RepID=A0A455SHA5_9CHLR|nr:hypothetical protein KTC_26040 [Thermosporothrix sp. COM3]
MKMNVVCDVSQIKKKVSAQENDIRNRAIGANLFFNNRCLDAYCGLRCAIRQPPKRLMSVRRLTGCILNAVSNSRSYCSRHARG